MQDSMRLSDAQDVIAQGAALHGIAIGEVLEFVFELNGILRAKTGDALDNPWLRELHTKKALALVCREWHVVALPFLYRDICIRYVWELVLLSRTLCSSPQTFGPLIRSLRITCYIPDNLVQVAWDSFDRILRHCPLLRNISFGEAFVYCLAFDTFWDTDSTSGPPFLPLLAQNTLGYDAILTQITAITFISDIEFHGKYTDASTMPVPMKLISKCSNLTKLTIDSDIWKQCAALKLALEFNAVEHLCFWMNGGSLAFASHWRLPKLRQLRIVNDPSILHHWTVDAKYLKSFLEVHGRKISYLDLNYSLWGALTPILIRCPSLQYLGLRTTHRCLHALVLPVAPDSSYTTPGAKIQHIDLAIPLDPDDEAFRDEVIENVRLLCDNLRLVDERILSILCHEVLDYFPPEKLGESTRTVDLFGWKIIQTSTSLMLETQGWSSEAWEEESYDSGSEGYHEVTEFWQDTDESTGVASRSVADTFFDPAASLSGSDDEGSEHSSEWMSDDESVEKDMVQVLLDEKLEWQAWIGSGGRDSRRATSDVVQAPVVQMTEHEFLDIFYERLARSAANAQDEGDGEESIHST